MTTKSQPGTLPVWALHGRPSASADAARLREIERILRMTPLERVTLALESRVPPPRPHDGTNDADDPRSR